MTSSGAESSERAPLIEIFTSIQGEGRWIGRPMVFVRTATCPIRCDYCDTQNSYRAPSAFSVDASLDGDREGSHEEPNPVTASRVAELATASWHASPLGGFGAPVVTLTGGEPLVFPAFLQALRSALGPAAKLHLETAALDAEALHQVAGSIDHLSADHKLPSALGGQDHGDTHAACVRHALEAGRTVDLKFVLTDGSTFEEFESGLARHRPDPRLLIVIQPATPQRDGGRAIGRAAPDLVHVCMGEAHRRGFDAVVLPQLHPVLGMR